MNDTASVPDTGTAADAAPAAVRPRPLRLGLEELLVTAKLLDLPLEGFTGLVSKGPLHWPSEDGAAAALRGLVARDLLVVSPAGAALRTRLVNLVTLVARPQLALRLYRASNVGPGDKPGTNIARVQTVLWYAEPAKAVELVRLPGSVYELLELTPDDMIGRVLNYTNLRPVPAVAIDGDRRSADGSGRPLELPMPLLREAGPAVDRGDLDAAVAALTPDIGAAAAKALTAALAADAPTYLVSSRYRLESGQIEGAMTAWIDAGEAGLWEVPADLVDSDDPKAVLTLTPASGQHLYASIVAGLPGAA